MNKIKLSKVAQDGSTLHLIEYLFNEDTFGREIMDHPDFQVPGFVNEGVVVLGLDGDKSPVEIVRRDEEGRLNNMLIGHVYEPFITVVEE